MDVWYENKCKLEIQNGRSTDGDELGIWFGWGG